MDQPQHVEALAREVIGAAIEVHRHVGPGQLESTYHRAMEVELRLRNVPFRSEAPVPIRYKGESIGEGRIDLMISDHALVVELKAVDQLAPIHEAQLLAYLRNTGCRLGLLMNFNTTLMKSGIRRMVL